MLALEWLGRLMIAGGAIGLAVYLDRASDKGFTPEVEVIAWVSLFAVLLVVGHALAIWVQRKQSRPKILGCIEDWWPLRPPRDIGIILVFRVRNEGVRTSFTNWGVRVICTAGEFNLRPVSGEKPPSIQSASGRQFKARPEADIIDQGTVVGANIEQAYIVAISHELTREELADHRLQIVVTCEDRFGKQWSLENCSDAPVNVLNDLAGTVFREVT